MFQPSSSLFIGTVPFDKTYRHVHYIPNREAQRQHFLSLCPMELRRDDYTYQRLDNSIVVPYNAELLYGYNYCMFQNANYGNRWFYSFINNIEYVNPNASRLHLELDIMQTWFPDTTLNACMVEREHVNNDAIGAHLKDEGLDPGELIVDWYTFDNQNQYLYPVIASAVEPQKDGTYINVGGDVYQGVYSGTSLTVFTSVDSMKEFITALANNGQQDAISAIYLVPSFCVQNKVAKSNGWGYWVDAAAGTPSETLSYNVGMGSLDGYVPRNNKTLIYPNQYFEVTNFVGQTQRFRLEFFASPGVATFDKTGGCSQASVLSYIPKGYNGNNGRCVENSISMGGFPTLQWVYQSYANMVGRSKFEFNLAEDFSGNSLATVQGDMTNLIPMNSFVSSLSNFNPLGMVADLATSQFNAQAELSKATRTPNTAKGGLSSTTSLVNIGSYTVGFRKYTCRAEIAKQIDDFFSQYGYLVSELKVPNLTGRRSWNFVKTNGANVQGKVPADVLNRINMMLDSGITFWHTGDVGNYALDNSIV